MSGKLIGIARTAQLRAPMEDVGSASVSAENGIAGDVRGTKPGRQVTILFREGWDDACRDLGVSLPWTTRRANLFVEGVERPRHIGGQISIGDVVLEVTQQTSPCMLMEHFHTGLKAALSADWRGGVCCRVVSAGAFHLGDKVQIT
jgi:MOSC domain-containing protein YiiM